MKVNLWYNYQNNSTGPGKVVQNLLAGLCELGVEVCQDEEELGAPNGCLQGGVSRYLDLPEDTLMGPNCFVQPKDEPMTLARYSRFVCPSEWVKNLYQGYGNEEVTRGKEIAVWSVGIDTELFCPTPQTKPQDVLLYVKNRTPEEVASVVGALRALGKNGTVLTYGGYREADLVDVCQRSRGCVLLTNTESQGIGYMEILSMGLPCYVYDKETWEGVCPATSAPYHTPECGIKVAGLDHSRLPEFFSDLEKFDPRGYIEKNHTLVKGAERYLEILTKKERP